MPRWQNGSGTLRFVQTDAGETTPANEPPPPEATTPTTPSAAPSTPLAIPLEIAASYRARTRGLLGRDGIDGALLLTPASGVHTFRMRFPLDIAYLTRDLTVLAVRTMRPGRLGRPRLRARHVLEAEAGAMTRWGLRPGTRLTIDTP
ncbi:DUF192 domain-containing protein [Streptomyces paromomycinus]|uniref:DUF192 domain-containing protein n=1 Tax=Streptomyces paromomycinus TaxID=92743 RepID=A0A401W1Z1_STREY|nr:DUF192 domain-containing protein [Streptomyces paromomycinus]GCD43339.1 hypothetical protein GKJPGBOP_03020 [Streptomyces paromomycinus]